MKIDLGALSDNELESLLDRVNKVYCERKRILGRKIYHLRIAKKISKKKLAEKMNNSRNWNKFNYKNITEFEEFGHACAKHLLELAMSCLNEIIKEEENK